MTARVIPIRRAKPVAQRLPHDPVIRGYHVVYRGAGTACPGCGRSHWYVGRLSAECAFCETAIGLVEPSHG